ncbi:gamma-glutamyltransferase family protein [Ramlibacter tataouinensis]|nr:gamma-glutamyltransferase family protein [Ramlibacter tataouinensis]
MRFPLRHRPVTAVLFSLLLLGGCGGGDDRPPAGAPLAVQAKGTANPSQSDPSCAALTANGSVVVGSGLPGDPAAPELASGYRTGLQAVHAKSFMVVTANPLASKAGCDVLKAGGTAADAAVAVQAVLGLVEPQSSGLGGGAFLMHYDARTQVVQTYDGRETAPAAATENHLRWIDDQNDRTTPRPSARASGRSIGTPGAVRMLELVHQEHGRKPWKNLFDAGIDLADNGFRIPGRMADAIAGARTNLQRDAEAAATYLNPDGSAKALGTVLTIPAYAATLRAIAEGGADAFYTGPIARDIVAKINVTASADGSTPITPGKTTAADLANYRAKKRDAVCTTYRVYWVCGMGPPSSGGIAVAQALGILENYDLRLYPPTDVDNEGGRPQAMAVHLVTEAQRLAYADRDKYVADTDYQPLPGNGVATMVDKDYLRARAALINPATSMRTAQPGNLGPVPAGIMPPSPESGTTHMTIVDRDGNVVSMTTTIEAGFGSYHMARGFMLNNELTDFSAAPADANGQPIANRVQAGKRPRSSMAPTLVFRKAADGSRGEFLMATGSPGGAAIIQYVTKTLVSALDWNLDAQQATSLVNFGASNSPNTSIGGEHPKINAANNGANDPLVLELRAMGHTVNVGSQASGVGTVIRLQDRKGTLQGGADPRREGLVLGDTFTP